MEDLISFLGERRNQFKGNSKDLDKVIKKLDAAWHAPTSEKHTKRMEPFAKIPELVDFANHALKLYFIKCNQFQRDESGFGQYDIKESWYLFTLLMYSPKVEEAIEFMVNSMLADRNPDLSIARRILTLCKNPPYAPLLEKVEAFFAQQNKGTKIYTWMNSLQVIPPSIYNWEFVIRIKADPIEGKEPKVSNNLSLTIKAHEPKGNGESFEIEVMDRERKISSSWNDFSTDSFIRLGWEKLELSETPSLENLKKFIAELEEMFCLKFNRKHDFQYFSKGFKNKANIQKWLLKEGVN